MLRPQRICLITALKAFTISRGERAARVTVNQLVLSFTELIILGLVNEILILERDLIRRGEFSQQVPFDQIFRSVRSLHRLYPSYGFTFRSPLTQPLTHCSTLSRIRLARLNNALSEMPSLPARVLRTSVLSRPSPW